MLPNHPTLVVAEQFAMLEALHPGRIDLGIGRAPGADPMTAAALRRTVEGLGADDFPAEVIDVLALLGQDLPGRAAVAAGRPGCPRRRPRRRRRRSGCWAPALFSAELAGSLGLPFSYAHHFNTGHTLAGRRRLPPRVPPVARARRAAPDGLGVGARRGLRRRGRATWPDPSRVMALSLRTGRPLGPIVSPEDAARELAALDPVAAADFFARVPGTQVATTADRAVDELAALVERTGADELMITGTAFDVATRVHTLEQVAARWPGSRPPPDGGQTGRRRAVRRTLVRRPGPVPRAGRGPASPHRRSRRARACRRRASTPSTGSPSRRRTCCSQVIASGGPAMSVETTGPNVERVPVQLATCRAPG